MKTLRRRSYRVISEFVTFSFGVMAAVIVVDLGPVLEGGPILGIAMCFVVIVMTRRIMGSRVVLDGPIVTVINPLMTYSVPCKEISRVSLGGDGTLVIWTRGGEKVLSVGFGGSLIDRFVGSTERAVKQIEDHRKRDSGSRDPGEFGQKFTTAWIADFSMGGALVCAAVAVAVGI
ncbi:hypothetical protein [Streptomyces sp. SID12501]|uniref:PH domain-containing protein n=1 Tax=Streptomyces sp. SID12501 TaxID=2706042 RepID=A0A6B3BYK8_9ACTN|nr:hypothetical protein [Streptomyces sp. SID12501]NEC89356.1 hypothetical protein [Streptomyces sp. SID12501]